MAWSDEARKAAAEAQPAVQRSGGYNPEPVNRAIANSGRFGGGKIGGREASMIHALIRGWH